jgi:hypothetical protein
MIGAGQAISVVAPGDMVIISPSVEYAALYLLHPVEPLILPFIWNPAGPLFQIEHFLPAGIQATSSSLPESAIYLLHCMLLERPPELVLISATNLLYFLFFSIDCSSSPILTDIYIVLHGRAGFLPAILGRAGMETRCQVWKPALHGTICITY